MCALQSWSPDGDGVVVRTAKGVYRAKKLVLTAGAWLPEIVPQLQVCRLYPSSRSAPSLDVSLLVAAELTAGGMCLPSHSASDADAKMH